MVNKLEVARNLRIVWTFLLLSNLIFFRINLLGSDTLMPILGQSVLDLSDLTPSIVIISSWVGSVFALIFSLIIRKVVFSPKKIFAKGILDQTSLKKWMRGQIISWGSAESVGFFGLILGSHGQTGMANIFFACAIVALILLRPIVSEVP